MTTAPILGILGHGAPRKPRHLAHRAERLPNPNVRTIEVRTYGGRIVRTIDVIGPEPKPKHRRTGIYS